ncbi:MBL fold metallo-hydrolase [Microvirga sp. KLBC 81]|uniref:MBL fold metallo-hydrolase n=1 Tax=Microvirga sp. KLBC 81 TaxID=1862707 RepID=UPI000D51AE22|nr:MBL fold metallo-hydrolase [Microvirga sp. KLBC 81]PVE22782.1 MBL fold metallo-hydrolase [Microvirga sp. KLBC 81]
MPYGHQPHLSRRGFCLCCLGATTIAATGGWLTPREVFAQSRNVVDSMRAAAADAPIKVHNLRSNISMLEGSGGNIGVLTGSDGLVLVDAGITASRPRILEALSGLDKGPIRHVINTHWHFDHSDGNEWLQKEGATIIAHENTRKHLATATRVEDWNFNFPPSPPGAVPSEVFATDKTMRVNGATLALKYYGPCHTDGDLSVTFTEADILHTGDTYWNGFYPFIDYSTGGSLDGTIRATETNLAAATDRMIVIPGHGPVSNKTELKAYRDMLVDIREKVAALKKQGRSLDDTVAAKPTASYDAKWGQFAVNPTLFTKLVYMGI